MSNTKHTIYIEPEDDITSVISNIKAAPKTSKVVALVLPKRGDALKSLVSMKLISAASKKLDKQIVLVTTDPQALRLAGATQIYVAKSLSSKPTLLAKKVAQPTVVSKPDIPKEEAKEDSEASENKSDDKSDVKSGDEDPLSEVEEKYKDDKSVEKTDSKLKESTAKGFKVPDFDGFRKKLLLIGAAIFLFGGSALALGVNKSSADVIIRTKTQELSTIVELDGALVESDDKLEVTLETINKQLTQPVIPTGTKDVGEAATGSMTVSNCTENSITVPVGTTFVANGLTFTATTSVSLSDGNFTLDDECKSSGNHIGSVNVRASENGDAYNITSRSYTVTSISGDVRATGSAMSGGFSEIVQVVQESDIQTALTQVKESGNDDDLLADLKSNLTSLELIPLEDTFNQEITNEQVSVSVGQETTQGIATIEVSYTMLGVKQTDVIQAVLPDLEEQAGELDIIDSGIDSAKYTVTDQGDGNYKISVAVKAQAGTLLSTDNFFDIIKGKAADEAAAELRMLSGVSQVEINTSPFWKNTVPEDIESVKITISTNE